MKQSNPKTEKAIVKLKVENFKKRYAKTQKVLVGGVRTGSGDSVQNRNIVQEDLRTGSAEAASAALQALHVPAVMTGTVTRQEAAVPQASSPQNLNQNQDIIYNYDCLLNTIGVENCDCYYCTLFNS